MIARPLDEGPDGARPARRGTSRVLRWIGIVALVAVIGAVILLWIIDNSMDAVEATVRRFPGVAQAASDKVFVPVAEGSVVELDGRRLAILTGLERLPVDMPGRDSLLVYKGAWAGGASAENSLRDTSLVGVVRADLASGVHVITLVPRARVSGRISVGLLTIRGPERVWDVYEGGPAR